MPTVPTYSSPQVQPQGLPSVREEAAPIDLAPKIRGQQAEAANQAGQQIADSAARIQLAMLQQANQLRVDDAINQAKEQAMKLTFDQASGFSNLKGSAALNRPDGQSLSQEYGGQLQSAIGSISDGLGNDAQRLAFQQHTQPLLQQFQSQVMRHENEQFSSYAMSVREGTIQNRMQEIGLNYNNPTVVDSAVKSIEASTYDLARLNGRSAEWAEAQARKMTSNAHLTALQAALQNNDPMYADAYLKKYSKQMDADDILRANGIITKEVDAKIGAAAASQAMSGLQPALQPSDFQRLVNLVVKQESGGRRYAPGGGLLTSPAGAKGEMQVLDSTNKNPGFGVKPARDDSPDERARVGRDYLQALLQKYQGNVAQGLAAYNAGAGAVDAALREAEKNKTGSSWLGYLPKETQGYVQNVLKNYGTGGGAPQAPTLLDVHNQVRKSLGDNARPETLRIALDAVTKQYSDFTAARKQREDTAVENAQRALIANGGNFSALSPEIRAAIPPGKFDDLMTFSDKLGKGTPVHTDWSLYYDLKKDPQVLGKTNLGALRDKLADSEFKELVNQQEKIRTGKAADMTELRSGKDILNNMMREVGIDPTPKDDDKKGAVVVGRIWNDFSNRVSAREQALGRKLNPDETRATAAQTFQSVQIPGSLWGTKPTVIGAVPPDQALSVPDQDRKQITDALKARKLPVTEESIQNLYRKHYGLAPLAQQ